MNWDHFGSTYTLLEAGEICGAEGVCLGNNGDQVDSRAETLHDLNVQRLQGVASGSDEVQAGVDTEINLVAAAGLLFLQHVGLMLVIQELDNGLPRVAVVDVVTEARGINHGEADYALSVTESTGRTEAPQLTLEELLLQLGLGDLNLNSLVNLLGMAALVVGIVLDGGGEQGVDEGCLSQARLASNLDACEQP